MSPSFALHFKTYDTRNFEFQKSLRRNTHMNKKHQRETPDTCKMLDLYFGSEMSQQYNARAEKYFRSIIERTCTRIPPSSYFYKVLYNRGTFPRNITIIYDLPYIMLSFKLSLKMTLIYRIKIVTLKTCHYITLSILL